MGREPRDSHHLTMGYRARAFQPDTGFVVLPDHRPRRRATCAIDRRDGQGVPGYADESVVGEVRCEHPNPGDRRSHASVATGPRNAPGCRVDFVKEVVHAAGVGVGMDDDERPSVTRVATEDVIVAMRDECILGSFPLIASAEQALRPHDCKQRGRDTSAQGFSPESRTPQNA
jgi:hypothetical protein